MEDKYREEVLANLQVFEPCLNLSEREYKRRFQKGGVLIACNGEESDSLEITAFYPYPENKTDIGRETRRILRDQFPGYFLSAISPRKKVNYFPSPVICEGEENFYGETLKKDYIDKEAIYAEDMKKAAIFYTVDYQYSGPEIYILYAVSSYPCEEVADMVEKAYPFDLHCMTYGKYEAEYKSMEKQKEKQKKEEEEARKRKEDKLWELKKFLKSPKSYQKLYKYYNDRILGRMSFIRSPAISIPGWKALQGGRR